MRALFGLWLALFWGSLAFAQDTDRSLQVPGLEETIDRLETLLAQQETPDASLSGKLEELKEFRDIFNRDSDRRERIIRYGVDMDVERSGDMVVTETLDVYAAGREIRRGIFRELPAVYKFMGVTRDYDYDLIGVTRDGEREAVSVSHNGNAVVWRIGRASVFLDPGRYRYVIRYRVADAVRRHDETDELYWNATGTYWAFPIETAVATVTFPVGASFTDLSVYTGGWGDADTNATATSQGNTAVFETTRPLSVREGLTISASVPKGVIDPLTDRQLREFWWLRYGAAVLLGAGGTALFGYFMLQWIRVGRDPDGPPVFARYEPPKGYGPAAVHYIHNRGHKGMTALSAQVLELGTQGVVEIEAQKKWTSITKQSEPTTPDGKLLLEYLLPYRQDHVVMDGKPDRTLYNGARQFLRQIAKRYGPAYYRRNLGLALLGVVGSVILVLIVLDAPVATNSPLVIGLFAALAAMNLLFLKLMPAPTVKGSKVAAEIEGFKLYLDTAEADRINTGGPDREQPPMMSIELYERFLPYAVALGVEKNWTKHFKATLPKEAGEYRPSYARGSRVFGGRGGPINVGSTIAKALTSGVASAAPVSQSSGSGGSGGWSSGGGGGGFSGGGGGGGGGGGW